MPRETRWTLYRSYPPRSEVVQMENLYLIQTGVQDLSCLKVIEFGITRRVKFWPRINKSRQVVCDGCSASQFHIQHAP